MSVRIYWGLFVVALVAIAFARSSPAHLGFWLAIGFALVMASPYFGVWTLGFMTVRAITLMFGIPLLFARGAADPGTTKFWLVFGIVLFISMPTGLVSLMFLREARTRGSREVNPGP
jgi:hypothetical protein